MSTGQRLTGSLGLSFRLFCAPSHVRHLAAVTLKRRSSTSAATASATIRLTDDMYASASKVLDEQTAPEAEIAAATEVIRAAAFQGRPAAQARVGRWHLFGICGAPKDARAAVVLLHSAAVAGDRDGQYWLGVYFSKAEEFAGVGTAAGAAADEPAGMPGSSDAEVDPARRQTLAREVMAEIKAMRKVAKANKIRRVQGLPLLPLRGGEPGDFASSDASASVDGSSSAPASASAYASEDPTRVPLRSNVRRAHHWLMAAALQDHADAQVALGNLVMAHAQGAGRAAGLGDARQAIGWYELAAQVSHHSLPTTMATATATASVEDDADAGDADDAAAAGAAASAVSEVEAEAALLQPAAPNVSGAPPHPDALFNLGMIYHDGLPGVVPRDRIRAAQYFKRAGKHPTRQRLLVTTPCPPLWHDESGSLIGFPFTHLHSYTSPYSYLFFSYFCSGAIRSRRPLLAGLLLPPRRRGSWDCARRSPGIAQFRASSWHGPPGRCALPVAPVSQWGDAARSRGSQ